MDKVPFKVKALYEYKSEHEDDLNFAPGTIITVTAVEDDDWYSGFHDNDSGMFPKNFVEKLPEEPAAPQVPEHPKHVSSPPAPQVSQEPVTPSTTGTKEPIGAAEETEQPRAAAKTETAKLPKPGIFPGPKSVRDDPYAVKKQFAGAGKSSYVPEVKPRDSYNIVGHAHHDVAPNAEVVREHDNRSEEEEAEEPKMSLKERIAMLQKRQQEEAEREAAALKRKEERKKKMQEEKERAKQQKEAQAGQVSATNTGASQLTQHDTGDLNSLSESVTSPVNAHPEAGGIPDVAESTEAPVEREATVDSDEDEDEDADEEDEEDEEELKRRRLVERMAKISGGRNMFGMMGMATPFGASAPTSKPKKKKAVSQDSEAVESKAVEAESPASSAPAVPAAVPIPGMALPGALPPKSDDTSLGGAVTKKPTQEDSSIAESDYTDEQNLAVTNESKGYHEVDENKPKSPTLESSESEPESNSRNDDMDLGTRSTLEGEATGYEADEDVSDRGALPKNELAPEAPKSPLKQAVVPPIPGGLPPVDTSEGTTTATKEEIPASSSPIHTRAPPPIPGAAPPTSEPKAAPPPVPTSEPKRAPPPVPEAVPTSPTLPPPIPGSIPPVPVPNSPTTTQKAPPLPTAHAPHAPSVPPPIPTEAPSAPVSRSTTGAFEPPVPARAPPSIIEQSNPTTTRQPPPPPVPSAPVPAPAGGQEDSSDDDFQDTSFGQPGKAPERVQTFSHPAPAPHVPISRANTVSSTGRTSGESQRRSSELSRTRSQGRAEQHQADIYLPILQDELRDVHQSSGWWIKDAVPESFQANLGIDFIFEVDKHRLIKRGHREVVYKDYYILFHDLSQIIVELQYDSDDPRTTVSVSNAYVKPPVANRRDILDQYHAKFGAQVVETAQSLLNTRVTNEFVSVVFQRVNGAGNLLSPIGKKSYGVTVYKNQNGHATKYDEVKPGDILCMKNAKFTSHGLGGLSSKSVTYGDGAHMYSGVIIEVDHKKEKLRVLDADETGLVRKESFKINDLKSGRLRVFRFVDRNFVGW